jgi:hypothetical protein
MAASHAGNSAFISPSYLCGMATFLLRVKLPDRPGALGAVASRIGGVRADVIAMEIAGRAEGDAVDEFVVELADEEHLALLVSEVAEVDGVELEMVRPVERGRPAGRRGAYASALALVSERTPEGVLAALASTAMDELDASWGAVLDLQEPALVESVGDVPAAPWLAAHVVEARSDVTGLRAAPLGSDVVDDVAFVDLAAWDLILLVGRPGWAFGPTESETLESLATLADARWVDLAQRDARVAHPSRAG